MRAGLDLSPARLRDATMRALVAEGREVVLWQTYPLPAQTVFQKRDASLGYPRSGVDGTDLATCRMYGGWPALKEARGLVERSSPTRNPNTLQSGSFGARPVVQK